MNIIKIESKVTSQVLPESLELEHLLFYYPLVCAQRVTLLKLTTKIVLRMRSKFDISHLYHKGPTRDTEFNHVHHTTPIFCRLT